MLASPAPEREIALELLFEAGGSGWELPEALRARYPGSFGFSGRRVVTNFVSTLDGVVAIPGVARANRLIADENDDDRFVMGLVRAAADVVLIGSGTLQASPNGLWTPESTYPDLAQAWTELRERLGKPAIPALAVLTGSGGVDVTHPAFTRGALVLTTDAGEQALRGRLPERSEAVSLGGGPLVDVSRALEALRDRGWDTVAAEVGPHVLGSMLREQLVDELFLTLSPILGGRLEGQTRFGMIEGAELLPDVRLAGELRSARRSGDHLFLHYALDRDTP